VWEQVGGCCSYRESVWFWSRWRRSELYEDRFDVGGSLLKCDRMLEVGSRDEAAFALKERR
jgi:hypothetical protein